LSSCKFNSDGFRAIGDWHHGIEMGHSIINDSLDDLLFVF
jgi:hypothetical protein